MSSAAELAATGLFNSGWYRTRYPDIAAAGIEPVEHYLQFGQAEGRSPNAYFDERFYVRTAGDTSALLPLLHYARIGEAGDLAPGPYFDPVWYRYAYELPRATGALAHFLRNALSGKYLPSAKLFVARHQEPYVSLKDTDATAEIVADKAAGKKMPTEAEVIAASGLFDANHYLINGSDVHEAALDPIEHFCAFGWQEERQPNIYFNTAWYLKTNPDVERSGTNPLLHYILKGEQDGRRPVVYFDPTWYRSRYGLSGARPVLAHFLDHRRSQRHSPNASFDLDWYLQRYFQQIGPNRDPFAHYLQTGTYNDVWPSPDFDPADYRKSCSGRRSRHFTWLLHPNRDNPLIRSMLETYV